MQWHPLQRVRPSSNGCFKHLKCVGRVDHSYPLGNETHSVAVSPYLDGFSGSDELLSLSTYRPVKVNYNGYWKSAHKMDYPLEFKPDVFHKHAMNLATDYLEPFYSRPLTEVTSVEWDKSPGYPWKTLNCKTKMDAIHHRDFIDVHDSYCTPIWVLSGKGDEKLDIVDIKEEKLRTFQIAPLELVIRQKLLFTAAQQAMIKRCHTNWIKYGMVLQYGGIQDFFLNLSKYDMRWESDVSGWDRKLQIMRDVYKIKYHHMKPYLDPETDKMFKYVEDAVCESIFLTHDGSLFQRQCGNPSGSGSTTEDNCVAHVIILFRLFSKIFYEYYGSMPTLEDILSNVDLGVFGDDNTGGCNAEFFGLTRDSFKKHLIDNYLFYSLIVKESACKIEVGKNDCKVSFLGLRCLGYPTFDFIPNINKLLSSITYASKKDSFLVVCVRALAIYRLLHFSTMRHLVRKFLMHLKSLPEMEELKNTDQAIYGLIHDFDGSRSIYTGRELSQWCF